METGRKKREDKVRRRDMKSMENIMKELTNLQEPQKLEALFTKYSELYEEYRSLSSSLSVSEKRCLSLQRENDQLQNERSKLVLARSRMEGLCRELQRQNRLIKEENIAKIREEEEKRREITTAFETTLNEVTSKLQENADKNLNLRDDTLDMAKQLETIRDQQGKMEKQMDLERQLAQALMQKAQLKLAAEREVWAEERQVLQDNCQKNQEMNLQLQTNIKALEENLEAYSGKYQEFRSSIMKSNQAFDDCKSEMSKMTKQIVSLEKEAKLWKTKSQRSEQTVIELATYKQVQDSKLDAADKKVKQLQKLCRQLQVDRSAYLKLLKGHGIEASSQADVDENVLNENMVVQEQKTEKEKQLEMLKDNLKHLQAKLTNIQVSPETIAEVQLPNDHNNDCDTKNGNCDLQAQNPANLECNSQTPQPNNSPLD